MASRTFRLGEEFDNTNDFFEGPEVALKTNPTYKVLKFIIYSFQMAVVTSDFPGSFTMVSKPAKGPAITTKWMVMKMMMRCDVMAMVRVKAPRGQVSPSNGTCTSVE